LVYFAIFLLHCGSYDPCLYFVYGIYVPVYCYFDLVVVFLYLRFVWCCLPVLVMGCVVWYNIPNPNHYASNNLHGVIFRKKAIFVVNTPIMCTYSCLVIYTLLLRQ